MGDRGLSSKWYGARAGRQPGRWLVNVLLTGCN